MHLLLGCSIARDAGLKAGEDLILNRALGGNTWKRAADTIQHDLEIWETAAAAFGLERGRVVFWFSGNEAYDRRTGCNRLNEEPRGPLESTIAYVVNTAVQNQGRPLILGPLPRFGIDRMLPWEHTAAYKLDRKVKEVANEAEFVSLGKALTKKLRRRHVIVEECRDWFRTDGVHLSREGYHKVAQVALFPGWLAVNSNGL